MKNRNWIPAFAGVENVRTLSDYKGAQFGRAYGLLIKELYLLARAVIVLDKEQKIRYIQIVPEVAKEPDYDAAISAVKTVLREKQDSGRGGL